MKSKSRICGDLLFTQILTTTYVTSLMNSSLPERLLEEISEAAPLQEEHISETAWTLGKVVITLLVFALAGE